MRRNESKVPPSTLRLAAQADAPPVAHPNRQPPREVDCVEQLVKVYGRDHVNRAFDRILEDMDRLPGGPRRGDH